MATAGETVIAGRYRLERKLGQGGMGVVWAAVDEVLDRPVALKEVLSPAGDQRAVREAQAAARLTSPYIVTIHDVVTDLGRPWIVMELVPGRSLASVLEDGPLPEAKVADIATKVLKALAVAHESGVLHRDVKPANILLDDDRVVLSDFGIAAVDGHTTLTGSQDLIGSLEYLPPERMLGGDATTAADLWSLGLTLYRAVEGKSPFARPDLPATLAAAMTRAPDRPKHVTTLGPLLKRLLSKESTARGTARQALELLQDKPQAEPARREPKGRFAVLCAVMAVASVTAVLLPVSRPAVVREPATSPVAQTSEQETSEFVLQSFGTFQVVMPKSWPRSVSGHTVTWNDAEPDIEQMVKIGPVASTSVNPLRYQQEIAELLSGQPNYHGAMATEVPSADGHRAAADLEYLQIGKTGSPMVWTISRVELATSGQLYEVRIVIFSPAEARNTDHIREVVLESFRLH
jgi:serine/threonine protein kinase